MTTPGEPSGQAEKWIAYYQRGFAPWDSHAPCSQLVAGLSFERDITEAHHSARRRGDHGAVALAHQTSLAAAAAHDDDMVNDAAPWPSEGPHGGPCPEKMVKEMDHEIAQLDGQEAESTSKIEKLEGMIKIACRFVAVTVFESFRAQKPPDLALAREQALELSNQQTAAFEREIADIHESIRNMYAIQVRERLEATQQRLGEVLAIRHTEILEREGKITAAWEARKTEGARKELGPHLIVGGANGLAEWHCLELGCGSGSTAVWLASQGSRVVAVDLCAAPLLTARSRAIQAEVIPRCVFLQGDVFDLAYSSPTPPGLHGTRGGEGEGAMAERKRLTWALARDVQAEYMHGEIPPQELHVLPPLESTGAVDEGGTGGRGAEEAAGFDLSRSLQLKRVLAAGATVGGPGRRQAMGLGRGREARPALPQGGAFDFIVDVQCYHVLRAIDLERFARVVRDNLKCGGLYFVMTGALAPQVNVAGSAVPLLVLPASLPYPASPSQTC